ncbi:MAG: cytochrome c3 family protein [Deltaproteobacteria bacterium]|nr:cytochrome c3 family protein [Deltaproteobacteria bacterium]
MKNHVLRPLFLVIGVVLLFLAARTVLVPADFGVHERGYMYGWYRKGNEAEWKAVKVKYKTVAYCKECHRDKYDDIKSSPHANIECENCHGPALGHPDDPPTLSIDRRREHCIRCHARLPYKTSGRGDIRGINPLTHHVEAECTMCHYPHNPKREVKK